jgi:hypothetical protein
MESLLLSVAHYWSLRETLDRQVELLERHFRQEEMRAAQMELAALLGMTGRISMRGAAAGRSATKGQAQDVVATLEKLSNEGTMPRFLVQSDDLPRVGPLLGAVSVGDERGVSARLEALEAAQRAGIEEMRRMVVATMARSAVVQPAAPDIVVTGPLAYAAVAGGAGGPGGSVAGSAPAHRPPPPAQQEQFFGRLSRATGAGRQAGQGARVERSTSKKRRLGEEGEWQDVAPRRKPKPRAKAATGTAVLAGFSDLAGPAEFWIGNTRPDTRQEQVTEALIECARIKGVEGFKVEDVMSLTKEDNPRSRSWRVQVPASMKEAMADHAMFPYGWKHRPFHAGRRPQEAAAEGQGVPVGTGQGTTVVAGAAAVTA